MTEHHTERHVDTSVADARRITSLTGVGLSVSGLLLIVAQVIWSSHFANMMKELQGLAGETIGLHTNVPGFGVMVLGAILLLASIVRLPKVTLGKD